MKKMYSKKGLMVKAVLVLSIVPFLLQSSYASNSTSMIGVNYGRLGNNLPSPYQSIQLLLSRKVGNVKLYDADPEVLKLLSDTGIHVSIMLPNQEISTVASNESYADTWIRDNVLAHYPSTKIRFVLVGNEVFSYDDRKMWLDLVPAMRRIKKSLNKHKIHNIKVGTPLAMDALESTFPPSSGRFRPVIPSEVIVPLMRFLNSTKSFFFVDVYTYFPWSANPANMSLDYALLRNGTNETYYKDPDSGLTYTNLLDQMLDSVHFAMRKLGFDDIRIAIAETGWPHDGDIDEPGANVYSAATYVSNLVAKVTSDPPLGTPAKPGIEIPTFVFSLYDENQKPGPGTERYWGLLNHTGKPIYEVDLTGTSTENENTTLPEPLNDEPYKGKIWCVVGSTASPDDLGPALEFACREGNGTCDALSPGKVCYEPISVVSHASYAFSSYWAQFRSSGASCYFGGLATQTTTDPGHGSCEFPSVLI